MVRAGVVKHPMDWKHSGYHEIVKPKKRNQLLDRKKLINKLDFEEEDLIKQYNSWIKEALRKGNLTRDAVWSSNFAAGNKEFVEKIKRRLHKITTQGPRLLSGREQAVWEESATYGQAVENNMLFDWNLESEKANYING